MVNNKKEENKKGTISSSLLLVLQKYHKTDEKSTHSSDFLDLDPSQQTAQVTQKV